MGCVLNWDLWVRNAPTRPQVVKLVFFRNYAFFAGDRKGRPYDKPTVFL